MTTGGSPFPYPAYYDAVDTAAATGQRRYLRAIRLRLYALVLAALGGLSWHVGTVPVLAWLALVGFAATVILELYVVSAGPDKLWYEARAAAESVKTLTWRFVVGGEPFARALSATEAQDRFRKRLVAVGRDLSHDQVPPSTGTTELVPPALLTARAADFATRRALYTTHRIDDQLRWYESRSCENARRSQQFLVASLLLELAGVLAAAARIAFDWDVDLLGIAAALISGVAAWAQTRQYTTLSTAYAVTARELVAIRDELGSADENGWAQFVDRAEEAISREHTLWRSTHGNLARIAQ